MAKNFFFSYVFCKLNNYLEIETKSTEIHAFLQKLLPFAQKVACEKTKIRAFVRLKKKFNFPKTPISRAKKEYVSSIMVQRTIPGSINAKKFLTKMACVIWDGLPLINYKCKSCHKNIFQKNFSKKIQRFWNKELQYKIWYRNISCNYLVTKVYFCATF